MRAASESLKGVDHACDITSAKPEFIEFIHTCSPAAILSLLDDHVALVAERESLGTALLRLTNYVESFPGNVEDGDELRSLIVEARGALLTFDNAALATGEQRCANCKAIIDTETDHHIPADESTTGKEVWLCEVCAFA